MSADFYKQHGREERTAGGVAPRLSGPGGRRGFTLLEMLVSLIIGTIMVGGVMGLISTSMQHKFRIQEKSRIQPILETAAQTILADPKRIAEGSVSFGELAGSPVVAIQAAPVNIRDSRTGNKAGELYHVILSYRTGQLEFSVLVPPADRK